MSNRKNAKLMTGNEACAEAALFAGMRFFAGYPITPSTEIAEFLARRLPHVGGTFVQMEDEIASMAAIIGASLAGVKSMTATSGPGFSLMQENIGYATMTEIPCVVVNVQRGGPSTGLPTLPSQADVMQARWGTHGDHPVIAVAPSTVRETYDWTIKAFNLSERFRTPVILLLDEIVGHISEKIVYPLRREIELIERERTSRDPESYLPYENTDSDIPPFAEFGAGYRYHVTGLNHDETGFPTNDPKKVDTLNRRINRKIERYRSEIIAYSESSLEDAEICVVAYGSSARSAHRAVLDARKSGCKVGIFQPFVLWPFPYERLSQIAQRIENFVVPEMNLGQIAHEVSCATKRDIARVNRIDGGLITPDEILEEIKNVSIR
ncbi:MAG: 2-oxoacid:acceptor oxidoreductase subunit alpha [candidate division WOR-3 bacterium]|nr:MAG: 2-oxoacid:acceptor oxidoreductase subunit alpha [candidate division WOR-3 bacterium]